VVLEGDSGRCGGRLRRLRSRRDDSVAALRAAFDERAAPPRRVMPTRTRVSASMPLVDDVDGYDVDADHDSNQTWQPAAASGPDA
jgi:hypothetical protein